MTNREVVTAFFASYQAHSSEGMLACLDPRVEFRDLAFERITGADVRAMWRWFCQPTETRPKPVEVPEFTILQAEGDRVLAEYSVRYSPSAGRLVHYRIRSELSLRDGRIVRQIDKPTISTFQFARMAKGFPVCLLALIGAFKPLTRRIMRKKLDEFMMSPRAQGAAASV